MCGIAGMLARDPGRRADASVVARMAARLRHRGPDDGHVWADGPIALGHRRLSVIDLSPRGRQPMSNEDGSVWVVFNGEIYDHAVLRDELVAKGHTFRSETDTEVLVHLYEEHGPKLLDRIDGMFAFALWDARERRLLLARDHLGEKPLFYHEDGAVLRFASEPRALLADPAVRPEADPRAIDQYLTYGYVPSPGAAFRGMRKLPPGHVLDVRGGRLELRRYWALRYGPKRRGSEAELAEELHDRLRGAVRRRLVADVPLGAFLSGGLDSSLVVALMREVGTGPLRTFSIGFEEQRYDELAYARLVAERFGTEHHERIVRPDAAALLPRLVRQYGEPYADSSALPTFLLCEMARSAVTVALSGDGGDESFAGYDRYLGLVLTSGFDRMPRPLLRGVARGLSRLARGSGPKTVPYRLARLAEGLAVPRLERYGRWISVLDEAARARLYTPELLAELDGRSPSDVLAEAFAGEPLAIVEAAMRADVRLYLPDDILVKIDIASMAHGLEVRAPLLDRRVVEFAATLPPSWKLRGLVRKALLRRVARGILPPPILARRKMGFAVPIDRWLRGELREMANDVLLDARARSRGWLRTAEVSRLLREHERGEAHHHAKLWALLVLELWHREFIDAAGRGEDRVRETGECAA
jgi:asparagine synthase (glutamine-hydrolysing)